MKGLKLNRYLAIGTMTLAALAGTSAFAMNETPAEIAMLPSYCDARIGSKSPEAERYWDEKLGHENWIHMHHYCGGLAEMDRYFRMVRAIDKRTTLERALWEFDYVLKYTSPAFPLRADAHYNRGKTHLLEGKDGLALDDFVKALELSPGMPAASIELANLYKKQGKKDQALNVLKTAMAQFPSHKGLRRHYQELGGNLADLPETAQAPAAPPQTETPKAAEAETPAATAEPAKSPVTAVKTEAPEQKIGNKTNPWCRFCPDAPAEAAQPKAN